MDYCGLKSSIVSTVLPVKNIVVPTRKKIRKIRKIKGIKDGLAETGARKGFFITHNQEVKPEGIKLIPALK